MLYRFITNINEVILNECFQVPIARQRHFVFLFVITNNYLGRNSRRIKLRRDLLPNTNLEDVLAIIVGAD